MGVTRNKRLVESRAFMRAHFVLSGREWETKESAEWDPWIRRSNAPDVAKQNMAPRDNPASTKRTRESLYAMYLHYSTVLAVSC